MWNVVGRFIFSTILQIWYVKVRISRSISESPLDFEITRVDCNKNIFIINIYLKIVSSPWRLPCFIFILFRSKHCCVIFSGPSSQMRNSKWPLLKELTRSLTSITFLPRPYFLLIAWVVYVPPNSWSRGPSYGSPHSPHWPPCFLIVWKWK